MKEVDIKIVSLHPLAHVPTFGTEGSAGADLYGIEDQYVHAGEPAKIRTGLLRPSRRRDGLEAALQGDELCLNLIL